MTSAILAFLASKIGIYVVGIIVALGAFVGIWIRAKHLGAAAERQKQAAQDRHAIDEAQAIDDAVAGRAASENRKRLKGWGPK